MPSVLDGDATRLPVGDRSVDVVISNGVLNLVPDKQQALGEIARVLKPGGRAQIADIVIGEVLPESALRDIEVALPVWRASAVGVYRFWRDLGYALGAVVAGVSADVLGLAGAMWVVAGMTFTSGLVTAFRMSETWVPKIRPTRR